MGIGLGTGDGFWERAAFSIEKSEKARDFV